MGCTGLISLKAHPEKIQAQAQISSTWARCGLNNVKPGFVLAMLWLSFHKSFIRPDSKLYSNLKNDPNLD